MEYEHVINQHEGKTRLKLMLTVLLCDDGLEHHNGKDKANHAVALKAASAELAARAAAFDKEAKEIFAKEAAEAKAKEAAEAKAKAAAEAKQ